MVFFIIISRTPKYEATAKLMVEKNQDSEKAVLLGITDWVSSDNYNWINSEVEVIKSYPVAIASLESSGREKFLNDKSKEPIEIQFKSAAFKFQSALNVINNKNSNIIDISYFSPEPEFARNVVENVVENYIAYRSALEKESEEFDFLEEQLSLVNNQINDLEQVQAKFKKQMGMLNTEAQTEIFLTRLREFEKQITDVRSNKFSKKARLEIIKEQIRKDGQFNIPQTESSDSPSREKYIAQIKGNLLNLEIEKSRLGQQYKNEHNEIKRLDDQIAATRQKIKDEIKQIIESEEASLKALNAQEAELNKAIYETNQEIKNFSQKEYAYSQINRGIDDNKEIYSMLLKQREEARISMTNLNDGLNIKIVTPAIVSDKPVKPNKPLFLFIGGLFALLAGFTFTMGAIYFDDTIETQDDLEKFTGIPVLGTIRNI